MKSDVNIGLPFSVADLKAFVTLCTNDAYAVGACVMAESLRTSGVTKYPIYVLISEDLSSHARSLLLRLFDGLIEVNSLLSVDLDLLRNMGRIDLLGALTKLHIWSLDGTSLIKFTLPNDSRFHSFHAEMFKSNTMWSLRTTTLDCANYVGPLNLTRIIYVDADMLFIQSIDELFDLPPYVTFAACPDIGWPDCFNTGFMVLNPDNKIATRLFQLATISGSSFDGADQGLLNEFFAQWSLSNDSTNTRRLPFVYNVCFSLSYTYAPAYKHYSKSIKAIHFLGAGNKPWQARRLPESSEYQESSSSWILGSQGLVSEESLPFLKKWWNIYDNLVRLHVNNFGGLTTFGIFGGNWNQQSDLSSLSHKKGRPTFPSNLLSFDQTLENDPTINLDFSNLHCNDSSLVTANTSNLSKYRISWNPVLEKRFHKKNLKYSKSYGFSLTDKDVKILNRSDDDSDDFDFSKGHKQSK